MNENMIETIRKWGFPEAIKSLSNRKIGFVFNSSEIKIQSQYYENLHCEKGATKFCIYDFTNEKILFSMDFFSQNPILLQLPNEKPYIKLELLNVNDHELRKKGIAGYYLDNLIQYCKNENYFFIKINPCTDADIFTGENSKNSLDIDSLKDFYKRKSTNDVKIVFIGEKIS